MTQQINEARPAGRVLARMSYEQFLGWDSENQHVEWVDGEVIEMPPVSEGHQDLLVFLLALLRPFVEAHDLGKLLFDPFQMKTGPALPGRAPDILFVSNKNLPRLKQNYLAGPADLVVEIISPGSGATDRGAKFDEYEKGGVREYWLIDPLRGQAQFYQRSRGMVRLIEIGSNGIYRSAVLKGLWLNVDWLFAKHRPKVVDVLKLWKLV